MFNQSRLSLLQTRRPRRHQTRAAAMPIFESLESRVLLSGALFALPVTAPLPQHPNTPAAAPAISIHHAPPTLHLTDDGDTSDPTTDPSADTSGDPATDPASDPTTDPSPDPSSDPSPDPTSDPTTDPSSDPSPDPTTNPSSDPTTDPSTEPSTEPGTQPATEPQTNPDTEPTTPADGSCDFPIDTTPDISFGTTTTALTASASTITAGDTLTLTAYVNDSTANGDLPQGAVTFYDGRKVLGYSDLAGDQTATLATAALSAGVHKIAATFSASNDFNDSTSGTLRIVVMEHSLADDQRYIAALYQDLLHRAVDPSGQATWTAALEGGATFSNVATAITTSREYQADVVDSFYVTYLGRHAEPGGLNAWVNQMQSGQDAEQIRAGILGSEEYFARIGGTNSTYITALYQDFLGRAPDPTGFAAWTTLLAGSSHTRAAVSLEISNSAENRADTIGGFYQTYLHRAADPSGLAAWSQLLANGVTQSQIVTAFVTAPEYLALNGIA